MLLHCVTQGIRAPLIASFFFFNDTATTEIYTLSLHDALPIWLGRRALPPAGDPVRPAPSPQRRSAHPGEHRDVPRAPRSEEHTSELQSRQYLVCRLLLEKKNNDESTPHHRQYPSPADGI